MDLATLSLVREVFLVLGRSTIGSVELKLFTFLSWWLGFVNLNLINKLLLVISKILVSLSIILILAREQTL